MVNRKEEILKLIEEGYSTAKELARYFNVSLMTIYRDLRELEEEGKIIRRHGNVEIKREEEFKENVCAVCKKDTDLRLAFIYILKGGKKIHACCAHCGLIAYRNINQDSIEIGITRDFITNNPVNIFTSSFVVGGTVSPCCKPPAFVFAEREHAERFAKGFGGYVLDFGEATLKMEELMKIGQRVDISI